MRAVLLAEAEEKGVASLSCTLAQELPSQFITYQCVLSRRNRGCSQHQEVIAIYCADFA